MGAHDTDLIRVMGLIYMGAQLRRVTLAGSGQWD